MLVKKVTICLIKPDSQTVVIPALTGIHSVFGVGIVIGTVMLFMVFASNTGLGGAGNPASGNEFFHVNHHDTDWITVSVRIKLAEK